MKKIKTMVFLGILIASYFSAVGLVAAQDPGEPFIQVTQVLVDQFNETENSEQSSMWVFGPQPNIRIQYSDNGTDISENNFRVESETELLVNITIPQEFLGEGVNLEIVKFWGSAGEVGTARAIFLLQYNVSSDVWIAPVTVYYEPSSDRPSLGRFLSFNSANSAFTETESSYNIVWAINFTSKVVTDEFWTGMEAIDDLGRPVTPSWLARQTTGSFESPPIGLGVDINPQQFALPDYYYGEITDIDGNLIHYVEENDTFTVNLWANEQFGDILLPFSFLTWESQYKKTLNLSMPIDFWDYNTNWTHTVTPSVAYSDVGLEMFLKHNVTGTYVLVGHPNITWYWNDLGGGIGMWWLNYQVDVNKTANLSDYFVINEALTGEYNDGMGVRWTGYFTNKTHMQNDPTKIGATTTVWPWLAVVRDINGDNIDPRPEIYEENTMTLAYKDAYVIASARDGSGNIVSSGLQNEPLTIDMDFYVPEERINGTEYTTWDGTPLKIQHDFQNITIGLKGGLVWANATHVNRAEIWYYVTYDALTGTWTNTTEVTIGVYTLVSNIKIDTIKLVGSVWDVTTFDLELGSDISHLQFNFTFGGEAPSMVFDDSKIMVGYNETVWFWSGDWVLADSTTKLSEIKNNIVWSPRRFTLGSLPTYRPQKWVVTPDGALDLDGNIWTTDDQYYIKRTAYWDDWGNQTVEGMFVNILFDPSPGQPGDEFRSNTWMGVIKRMIEFQANETFYWYKASDWSPVGVTEMQEIRSLVWDDQDANIAHPDYAFVAWMSKNRTIDLSGIPELASGSWENTWFAWGTEEHFLVGISESQRSWASFRAEYAGMLLFNDTNGNEAPDFSIDDRTVTTDEVTHVVLIESVGNVTLRPAIDTEQMIIQERYPADTTIRFGISIYDVNVTLYPLRIQNSDGIRSPWDIRTSYEGLMGLNQSVFDYAISTATISEMGFDIAFSIDLVQYDPHDPTTWNHAASFKTNQTIGDWSLNNFDDSMLEGRGLAINYFGLLSTVTGARYQAGSRPVTDTNAGSETADYYTFGSENTPFANVSMGDLPYTSAADVPSHSIEWMSGSSTAPIGAFSLMYQSESGQTVTRWNVESSMLFMTAGYTHWDGQEVICDPVFVAYTSSHNSGSGGTTTSSTSNPSTTETPTTTPTTTIGRDLGLYILVGGIVVVSVIVCVAVRRRQ